MASNYAEIKEAEKKKQRLEAEAGYLIDKPDKCDEVEKMLKWAVLNEANTLITKENRKEK